MTSASKSTRASSRCAAVCRAARRGALQRRSVAARSPIMDHPARRVPAVRRGECRARRSECPRLDASAGHGPHHELRECPGPRGGRAAVQVRKVGRSVSFARLDVPRRRHYLESLVTIGTLARRLARAIPGGPVPRSARAHDQLRRSRATDSRSRQRLSFEFDPATTGWWDGQRSSLGEVRGWLRLTRRDTVGSLVPALCD